MEIDRRDLLTGLAATAAVMSPETAGADAEEDTTAPAPSPCAVIGVPACTA